MNRVSIEDRFAIEDLFARYSWALDTGNPEALAMTFIPNCRVVEEVFEDPDIWEGRDGIRAMGRHYMNAVNFPGRQHHLSMPIYEAKGDYHCNVKSFVFVTECRGEPPMELRFSGYYTDELVKLDGVWFFASRIIRLWDGEVLANFPNQGQFAPRKRPADLIIKR
jgi:hypothetical protein